MKNRSKIIPLIIYLVLLVVIFSWANNLFGQDVNDIPYSQVVALFRQEQVRKFVVKDQAITLYLRSPYNGETTLTTSLASPESFRLEMNDLLREQSESGVLESYHFVPDKTFSVYDLILPLLVVGLVLLFAWAMLMNRSNNSNPLNNFGKARTVLGVPDGKKVTFADVAGADEEKDELQEVVDFLKNPEKFTEIGARIPHGLRKAGGS